jgi:hypothetical protein
MIGLFILGVLILYLVFAVWIVKRQKTKRARWITIVILVLIPTWDEIVGRAYFSYLCATEAGMKIYSSVQLPQEFWTEGGQLRFVDREALIRNLGYRFEFSVEFDEHYSPISRIKRHAHTIIDKKANEMLGRYVRFIYFGGWVINHTGMHVSGNGCPTVTEYDFSEFIHKVFMPASVRR